MKTQVPADSSHHCRRRKRGVIAGNWSRGEATRGERATRREAKAGDERLRDHRSLPNKCHIMSICSTIEPDPAYVGGVAELDLAIRFLYDPPRKNLLGCARRAEYLFHLRPLLSLAYGWALAGETFGREIETRSRLGGCKAEWNSLQPRQRKQGRLSKI